MFRSCLIGFFGLTSYASIELVATTGIVPSVCYDVAFPTSPVDIVVTADVFSSASPETPIYVRIAIRPDHTTRLDSTRVGLDHDPIDLAARIIASPPGEVHDVRINLAPDSVSIVRWMEGERAFWLRITQSSATWLSIDGIEAPPAKDHAVVFSLGVAASVSVSQNSPLLPDEWANLGGNKRRSGLFESTEIYVNHEVPPNPILPSTITALFSLYDWTTEGILSAEHEDGIVIGTELDPTHTLPVRVAQANHSCSRILFPWLSYSVDFQSRVFISNPNPVSADVILSGRRSGESSFEANIHLPAYGSTHAALSDLFPELELGLGLSVVAESSSRGLVGQWVTSGLHSPTGDSPSGGNAINLAPEGRRGFGTALWMGSLAPSAGSVSGFVVVNVGETPTNATLLLINSNGNIVSTTTLEDCLPYTPKALLSSELTESASANENLVVISEAEPIVGVAFQFNQLLEPAIVQGTPIDFVVPTD